MAKPLDIAAAELSLKDKVSKPIKNIEKGMKKSRRSFVRAEKQSKKNEKQNLRQAKSVTKLEKASVKLAKTQKKTNNLQKKTNRLKKQETRLQRTASRTRSIGRGAARGARSFGRGAAGAGRGLRKGGKKIGGALSSFTGGIGGIPIVGGAIAAILGAISATQTNFVAGVRLQKALLVEGTNFKQAFKNAADRAIIGERKSKLFRSRDTEAGLTSLRDKGVGAETVAGSQRTLARFTKSQGISTLSGGIAALTSGNIKAGRGLSTTDIKQIQELAPLLNDVSTASTGFKLILDILKGSKIEESAETFGKALVKISKTSNSIAESLEETTRQGASIKGGKDIFDANEKVRRKINTSIALLAGATADGVSSTIDATAEFIKDPAGAAGRAVTGAASAAWDWVTGSKKKKKKKKRARGGPIAANQPTIVGEDGPEIRTFSTSGSILSNSKSSQALSSLAAPDKKQPKLTGDRGPEIKPFSTVNSNLTNSNPRQTLSSLENQKKPQASMSKPQVNFNPVLNFNMGNNVNPQETAQLVRKELTEMVNSIRFDTGMELQG